MSDGKSPRVNSLIAGNIRFQQGRFTEERERFLELLKGQSPRALYIGCADSRVVPNFIIDAGAGEVFVIRNVGAIVPPSDHPEAYSIAAAVEFAVYSLDVPRIVVCAHDHCGALKAISKGLDSGTALGKWLAIGAGAIAKTGADAGKLALPTLAEIFARSQHANLLAYPSVKSAIAIRNVTVHAWVYDPEHGRIRHMADDGAFHEAIADGPVSVWESSRR